MTYTYNLSGALIEQQYPSGRKVKTVLDNEGDLAQVQSQKNSADVFRNYASSFVYNSAGAVSSMKLGNGKFENTVYNSRLQPIQIGLGSSASTQDKLKLNYDYGTTQNNGNVLSQIITVPTVGSNPGFTATQAYSYDSLNRIAQATETIPNQTGWNQTFTYDRYGNRNFVEAPTTTLLKQCNNNTEVCVADRPKVNPSVDVAKNRLIGYDFDNAGNTTTDADTQTFIYDAENKQVQVSNAQGIVGQYFYDGDGKRVKKVVPGTGETTIFVYDATGKLVAEYSTIVEPASTAQISYLTNDHLGTPRITTDAIGQTISRRDFMPFGEEITRPTYGTDSLRQKFTSYERDSESGLDFAQARYYGGNYGRFTSPDNFLNSTRPENPATWNLYAYVLNNPLRYVDPSGEIERDADGNVIFHKTGGKEIEFKKKEKLKDSNGKEIKINGKTAYVTISWKADVGYVKADDGTKIEASKATTGLKIEITDKKGNIFQEQTDATQKAYDGAGYNNTTDCHGNTFASGQVWINNDQVENLMKGDGYRQVGKKETVQAGDVGIYSADGTLSPTSVQHSVTVNDVGATSVTSKGGITPLQPSIAPGPGPGTAWNPQENESVKLTYWTQRAKPKN